MSFFGRAANLVKGGLKSLGGGDAAERERAAKALEEDVGGAPIRRPIDSSKKVPAPTTPTEGHAAPERDEQGNVKRTL